MLEVWRYVALTEELWVSFIMCWIDNHKLNSEACVFGNKLMNVCYCESLMIFFWHRLGWRGNAKSLS